MWPAALRSCSHAFNAVAHCIPLNCEPKEATPSLSCFLSGILTINIFQRISWFCLSCRISSHIIVHDISILSIKKSCLGFGHNHSFTCRCRKDYREILHALYLVSPSVIIPCKTMAWKYSQGFYIVKIKNIYTTTKMPPTALSWQCHLLTLTIPHTPHIHHTNIYTTHTYTHT